MTWTCRNCGDLSLCECPPKTRDEYERRRNKIIVELELAESKVRQLRKKLAEPIPRKFLEDD